MTVLKKQRDLPFWVATFFLGLFALWTRLWRLGAIPAGMTWDEVALGYVGKMVVMTGRDEFGTLLPRIFPSFGDYKAPLAFYSTGLSTTLFGLSPWATRLPFALAGILSIYLIGRLAWRITQNRWLGLFAAATLIFSPWHTVFSRIAFESGLAFAGTTLFLLGWSEIKHATSSWSRRGWLLLAGIGWWGAVGVYHSARLSLPFILILCLIHDGIFSRRWLKSHLQELLVTGLGLGLTSLPLAWPVLFGSGGQRAEQTTWLFQTNSPFSFMAQLFQGITSHLTFQFLVLGETATLRHGTGQHGVLGLGWWVLFLIGLSTALTPLIRFAVQKKHRMSLRATLARVISRIEKLSNRPKAPHPVFPGFWVILLIIFLLPAAIGIEQPHANRALGALIPIIVLITLAAEELWHHWARTAAALVLGCLILLATLEYGVFWKDYTTDYPIRSSQEWLQGVLPTMQAAHDASSQGKSVIVSSQYGQPEMFYAFATNQSFVSFRNRDFGNVHFQTVSPNDQYAADIIFAAENEKLPIKPSYRIERLDGSTAFSVYVVR